jgi:large subunit ribosomal protein L13
MIVDVKNKPLGRAASIVAALLRGKNQPNFRPNVAPDIKVTVVNVAEIKLSGKKAEQKQYKRYSGYPGGLKIIALKTVFKKNPGEVFRKTVWGMLPKNKLRSRMIKNLIIKNGNA